MGATVSTITNALKYLYLPRIQETIAKATVLTDRLESSSEHTSASGRSAVVPINIRPSEAIGARGDGEALPTPQNQTYVESAVAYAYNYATIRITHPAIAASQNSKGAWIKVVQSEMGGIERDFKQDHNRQHFGWGNGVLGTTNGTGSGATSLVLDTGHKVKVNQVIDVWDATSGGSQELSAVTVTAVSGNTVTVASSTWGDGSYVYRAGSRGNECMGLMGIINDHSKNGNGGIGSFVQTLQGINRADYPEWNAHVFEGSTPGTGRQITSDILDDSILETEELGEGTLDFGITSRVQIRKIARLLTPDRRYSDSMELSGGFKAVKWSDIPIFSDKDCPIDVNGNDMLFFVDSDEMGFYDLMPVDWDDEDGNILHRNQGYATYDGTLFKYGNLGTTDAGNHMVIRDLLRTS